MVRPRIIPTLLLQDGALIKTRQFGEPKYVGDPINAVKIFNEKEVDELAIFDVGATMKGAPPNLPLLEKIAVESRMPLCYGGGVTNVADAIEIVGLGFEKVSISAAALDRIDLVREIAGVLGQQSVVVALDVRKTREASEYTIFTHNGTLKRESPLLEVVRRAEELGAGEIVINSIERDGMMQGYDIDLAKLVRSAIDTPLTMLGGAGDTEHMRQLIETVGVVGAAAGSMFVFKGSYRAVLITYARP